MATEELKDGGDATGWTLAVECWRRLKGKGIEGMR